MTMRGLVAGVLAGLLLTLPGTGWAQEAQRGAQKRPDGSLVGRLGDSALELGTFHALLIGINDYQHTDFAPAPQAPEVQKDVPAEYQRLLASWKRTRP